MNAYYFRRDKTAVLGAIKAQLNFQKANIIPRYNIRLQLNIQRAHNYHRLCMYETPWPDQPGETCL